jgi:uncharacterized protein (DUF4213/DUF364 family)
MTVIDKLKSAALAGGGTTLTADVRIGLGYTAVQLVDGRCGLAYTFRSETATGCSPFDVLRPLAGRPAADLINLLGSGDLTASSVGVAAANAVGNTAGVGGAGGDILEQLELYPSDSVGMVGNFIPIVSAVRSRVASLTIFELSAVPEDGILPTEMIPERLPDCQVALITATAIVNHTIDDVLAAAGNCREVVILGASTPLIREVFADTPVTGLSGVIVDSPRDVLQIVSEGGGIRMFKTCVRKVNVRL